MSAVFLRNASLKWQLVGLTAVSALAGFGAMAAISLVGPPPRDPPTEIAEIVSSLDAARSVPPGLVRDISAEPPDPGSLVAHGGLAAVVARDTGVSPMKVQAFSSGEPRMHRGEIRGDFLVTVRQADSHWVTVRKGADRALGHWLAVTALTVALLLAVFGLIGWFAAHRIARPIALLARAARRGRTGVPVAMPLLDAAPPEVREAADALADLYQRTLDHGRQQVTMLAAIAHDVGTPVARLAFRVEDLADDQREAAMHDIAVIRQMLGNALNLSRNANEASQEMDLAELCRELAAAEASSGRPVALSLREGIIVRGNPTALYRMVQNLVDNAWRYGGSARLAVSLDEGNAVLEVSDSGPGFPDMPVEELLRPFTRGDASRNRDSGGNGLGLAVAAHVAQQLGGSISLGRASDGGARALVVLPAVLRRPH